MASCVYFLFQMPFGRVHGQEHKLPVCSCSGLVSTRLTLCKYSRGQALLPTQMGIKPVS